MDCCPARREGGSWLAINCKMGKLSFWPATVAFICYSYGCCDCWMGCCRGRTKTATPFSIVIGFRLS